MEHAVHLAALTLLAAAALALLATAVQAVLATVALTLLGEGAVGSAENLHINSGFQLFHQKQEVMSSPFGPSRRET